MYAVVMATDFQGGFCADAGKRPRALVDVGGKPVIDHLFDFLSASPAIDMMHVRTNALYYPVFKDWLRECDHMGRVEISSNGVHLPEFELGFVEELENICSKMQFKDDILFVDGETIFDFSILPFLDFCSSRDGDVVAVNEISDRRLLKKGCVVSVTSDGRIIDFEEKPRLPKSNLLALSLCRLSAETTLFLKKYLMEGNSCDSLGSFFAWSYRRRPLFAYKAGGMGYQLKTPASYKKISSIFEKKRLK